ncbi:MAG: hypothetical protein AAF802_04980 [Planctomycetota bacterium]
MIGETLTIRDSGQDSNVYLVISSQASHSQCSFEIPSGFGSEHIGPLLNATHWFDRRGEQWRLRLDRSLSDVAEVLLQMFDSFEDPWKPTDRLRDAKEWIAMEAASTGLGVEVDFFQAAFLDAELRELLADQLRSLSGEDAAGIWNDPQVTLESGSARAELLSRYFRSGQSLAPLAKSITTRERVRLRHVERA